MCEQVTCKRAEKYGHHISQHRWLEIFLTCPDEFQSQLVIFVWEKNFYIPSACLAVPAIRDVCSRSMRAQCHIPCKHHPKRPKTQIVRNYNDCQVQPKIAIYMSDDIETWYP